MFAKFGGTDPRHTGEFLDEVSARASAQNEQYLELMETPTWHRLNDITNDMDWRDDLARLRDELLAKGLLDDIPAARAFWDQAEAVPQSAPALRYAVAAPGCKVKTRYIYQVFRITPKELVFAQTLFGFDLAAADPRIVAHQFRRRRGQPSPWPIMPSICACSGSCASSIPSVHVSLHAGELAPGLVPPEGLCCHVRLAVDRRWPTASATAST